MTKLDSILKSKDITLPTKVQLIKAMVFPIVTYGCESWTIKKAECWRIDVFELWCWRRLLRAPLIAKRSNQSILKEISPEYSLEQLMLKLKLQYFGHQIQRTDSLGKDPDAGKDQRQEEKGTTEDEMVGWQHLLNGHEFEQAPGVGEGQESLACCSPWGCKESDMTDWTKLICILGLPRWLSAKESACQCRRWKWLEFDHWVRKIHWRRKWQPNPVFLPGESHGQWTLVGYSPWGSKESDRTDCVQIHASAYLLKKILNFNTREITLHSSSKIHPHAHIIISDLFSIYKTATPRPRPGAVAGRTNPISKELWLRGRRRA